MSKKVIIIGGGAAGLTAGVSLASRGYQVELFESKSFPGGRLYSFVDPETGDVIDNGQHLMTGFYDNTFKLLDILNKRDSVFIQENLEIDFLEKNDNLYSFSCPKMPMSLSFLVALFRYSKFPKADLFRLIFKSRYLKKKLNSHESVKSFLNKLGQSEESLYAFFRPLVLATLNADVDQVSGRLFQEMLNVILKSKPGEASLVYSKVGLSDLIANPAVSFIEERGGKIHLSTSINRIVFDGEKVSGVVDSEGHEFSADKYIVALPPDKLNELIPDKDYSGLDEWKYSPIVSVNLWFEESVMDKAMVGILDSKLQWCFDKSKVLGSSGRYPYITYIISAAEGEASWKKEELIEYALSETKVYFKKTKGLDLIHSQVIKEKKATVLISPELEDRRIDIKSKWQNLYFAGDWVNTGLPATIESAIKSGFLAAQYI